MQTTSYQAEHGVSDGGLNILLEDFECAPTPVSLVHAGNSRASDKVRLEWPLAKDQRAHIHQTIAGWDLPVTHTTRRTGRPFTLVLEKTAALFKRDAAERQSLREDLEWLQKTSSEF